MKDENSVQETAPAKSVWLDQVQWGDDLFGENYY